MNIIYGVTGFGMGHIIQSSVIIERLLEREHTVIVVTHDRGLWYFPKHFPNLPLFHAPALHFGLAEEGIDFRRTAGHPANLAVEAGHIQVYKTMYEIQEQIGKPDLVITDLEMSCATMAYAFDIPLVIASRWSAFALPWHQPIDKFTPNASEMMLRIGYPKVNDYLMPYPFQAELPSPIITTPAVLRTQVQSIERNDFDDKKIVVYLSWHTQDNAEALIEILATAPDYQFKVFTHFNIVNEAQNVNITQVDAIEFIKELSTAAAVVASAGNNLITEACKLQLPYLAIPIPNYEQVLNASLMAQAEIGQWSYTLDATTLQSFIEHIPIYRSNFEDNPKLWPDYNGDEVIITLLADKYGV